MLTQETLKSLLYYNAETGIFTRRATSSSAAKAGDVAGGKTKCGYISIRVNGRKYYAHRLAWLYMTGEWPPYQIDHDDHIRHNNKWDNLNKATNQDNQKNGTMQKNNSSGITGVDQCKRNKMWRARIGVNGKDVFLGYFMDKFEAICARLSANNKYGFHKNHGGYKK